VSLRPLLVSHTAAPGGSNTVLLAMLDRRPPDVEPACVFLADGPTRDAVRERGIPVALVETGRAQHVWRAPGAVRALRALIRDHAADVVFSHLAKAHLYAGPAAWAAGVSALWWQHALPGQQNLQHRVAERIGAAAIVCSSDFTADLQRRRTPATDVVRIHPGVPSAPQAPPGDGTRVGTVARLQRWKRIERLLDAIPLVHAEVPDARFEVIGGGEDAAYEAELRSRGAAVTFTGHVDDAGERMAALDVLVHTAELEPFGLVVAEALARGVPVVAPARGGPAEIVRDGVDGRLVDPDDAGALAAAIVGLLRDADLRRRMGEAGRAHVGERFSEERMVREAWRLAARVAAARPARRPRR
jgi:glycosyltransferase involved in cell wall biosynthesis